jgi:hypothetical protein
MIIRLEFASFIPYITILHFLQNPKGTCLLSSKASNITPQKLKDNVYVSFWHIDDIASKYFFGGKVTIYSLWTHPGVLNVKILKFEKEISSDDIYYKLKPEELDALLIPFV